jgi:hypothetical protein
MNLAPNGSAALSAIRPAFVWDCMKRISALVRRTHLTLVMFVIVVSAASTCARAQNIDIYFPPGISGYDQQLGVTVLSRLRPLYAASGVRAGGFVLFPRADENVFYNSNLNGVAGSQSWGAETSAGLTAASDWSRDSLGAAIGIDHYQYFEFPGESYTDFNVGATGGYTIDDNQLTLSYFHSTYHQLGTSVASVRTTTPIADQTDSARIYYTFQFGRIALTPDFSVGVYRFGSATLGGSQTSLSFLNRNVMAGGVTARYSMSDEGGLLLVVRGMATDYVRPLPGQPSNNSDTGFALTGIDYQSKSVWRYRLLVGIEVREFAASQFQSRTAPIAEGSVIWQPTELTTVTGSLSRLIEDPQSAGSNGYVLTQAQLTVDHELRRDMILEARGGTQFVQFLQGGNQTNITGGVSMDWLINRNMRLSIGYDITKQTSISGNITGSTLASTTTGQFNQQVAAVTLHFAL